MAGLLLAAALGTVSLALVQRGGGGESPSPVAIQHAADMRAALAGLPSRGEVLGDPGAPVLVTEYADLLCPACRAFDMAEVPDLLPAVRRGELRLRLATWSILGPASERASLGAAAAAKQDRLWAFALVWYANQGDEATADAWVTEDYTEAVAQAAGLDMDRFRSDVADEAARDALLAKGAAEATELGLTGTPSVLVEGPGGRKLLPGVPTAAEVLAATKAVGA